MRDLEIIDNAIKAFESLGRLFPSIERPTAPLEQKEDEIPFLSVPDGAVILLKEKGSPMKTKEIVDDLQRRGKRIDAKDPMTSVYSGLDGAAEKGKLKKLGNGYWGLKDRD